MVLDFSYVSSIDSVSLLALEDIINNNKMRKKKILLCGLQASVRESLTKTDILEYIGEEFIHTTRPEGMEHAKTIALAAKKAVS